MPVQHGVSIAHGDYRFGNCLTDVDAGRIAAVLDWELCTLGDPLADVGYLGVYWFDGNAGERRAPTTRRRPAASRPTTTSSSGTPRAPAATSATSATTSRSAAGGWP